MKAKHIQFVHDRVCVLMCALSLLFAGCEYGIEQVKTDNADTIDPIESNSLGGGECDPDNSNNSLDSVGQIHNELVNLAESVAGPNAGEERVMEVVDSLLIDRLGSGVSSLLQDIEFAEDIIDSIDIDMLETYTNDLELSSFNKEIIYNIFTIMFDYDGTNVCEIIDEIKSLEDSLINLYSQQTLRYFLITASVGRYSLHYWDDRFEGEDELTEVMVRGFWKKFFIGTVDAAGAIAGGIMGGPTAAGNVAGAIVGAVAASTGAAELWDVFAEP